MAQSIKVNGRIISIMDMESMNFPMVPSTKDNGKTICFMELDSLSMRMAKNGKDNFVREYLRARNKFNSSKKKES